MTACSRKQYERLLGILLGVFIIPILSAQQVSRHKDDEACFMASRLKSARSMTVSIRTFTVENEEIWSRIGSGWIYQENGLVVTRQSVVHGSDSIEVTFIDGRKTQAWILNCDPISQVALLKTEDPYRFDADSRHCRKIETKDCVILLGNSLGVFPSVTLGHIFDFQENGYFLFHGSVPPGNTGGPLFNREGELVGMLAGRRRVEAHADPVGVGVRIERIERVLQGFLGYPPNQAGWIGLCVIDIPHQENGVRVVNVIPDSPADRASLCKGDTLLAVNGRAIQNATELARHVKAMSPRKRLIFDVRRRNEIESFMVEVGCVPTKK